MKTNRLSFLFALPLAVLLGGAVPLRAQQTTPLAVSSTEPRTNVVVSSNPALFTVLAGLNAAGYDVGVTPSPAGAMPSLRQRMRAQLRSIPAASDELRAFYLSHHRADPNQDLAQYIALALFLGNPPGLNINVPAVALPANAADVDDLPPILQRFYQQEDLASIWRTAQPAYEDALNRDAALTRKTVDQVNGFFRIPQAYSARQLFVFADPLISPTQTVALSYEDNYYIVVNLDLASQIQQVRHTYLHFLLEPLIGEYPAIVNQVKLQILPLVARAPALEPQFKDDAQLFYTECLVRAVELQLDPGTPAQKQQLVNQAMSQGLVLTQYWFDQLTDFRKDPANFIQFYPEAAFAVRLDEISGLTKHLTFSPAGDRPLVAQPIRVASLLEQGQARLRARTPDLAGAATLAQAALRQPRGDHASAYYLLAQVAVLRNQPAEATNDFQNAIVAARPSQAHIRTWSNIFLGRLFDAANNRPQAILCYKAAVAAADTPLSKATAEAGIKSPYVAPKRSVPPKSAPPAGF